MLDFLQILLLFVVGYVGSNWLSFLFGPYYGWNRVFVVLFASLFGAMLW